MRLKTNGFEEKLGFDVELGDSADGYSYVDGRIDGTALKVDAHHDESSGYFTSNFHLTENDLQSSVHDHSQVGRVYLKVDGPPTVVEGGSATPDSAVFGFSGAAMSFGITSDGYWTVADGKGRRLGGASPVPTTNSVLDIPVVSGQYYCLEVGINHVVVAGAGTNVIVYRIDGLQVACRVLTGIAGGSISSGIWFARCGATPSEANPATYVDDFALNDLYGSEQNTWPGPGHTVLCMPESVDTSGSWTTGTSFNVTGGGADGPDGPEDECWVGNQLVDNFLAHDAPDSEGGNSDKLVAISHVPQRGDDNLQGNPNVGGYSYSFGESRMLSNPSSYTSTEFVSKEPTDKPKPPACEFNGLQYENLYVKDWRGFFEAGVGDSITAPQNTSLIEGDIAVTYARPCFGRGNETGADGSKWESIFDDHTPGYVDVDALGQTLTIDVGSASSGYKFEEIMAYGATPTDIVLTRQTANKFVLNVSAMWTLVECMAEAQGPFPTSCAATGGPLICFV